MTSAINSGIYDWLRLAGRHVFLYKYKANTSFDKRLIPLSQAQLHVLLGVSSGCACRTMLLHDVRVADTYHIFFEISNALLIRGAFLFFNTNAF